MTFERRQEIERYRRVFLNSADGKKVLFDLLEAHGLFSTPDEFKATMKDIGEAPFLAMLIQGILLLRVAGIWTQDNMGRLFDAMAQLPLPDEQEIE